MKTLSRYWKICRISLNNEKNRYEYFLVPTAQKFFNQIFSPLSNPPEKDIQTTLNEYFNCNNSSVAEIDRSIAGLCLRCYVSYPILKACQKIDYLFAGEKQFTYQDLLPFVLNDDGKTLIILDENNKTQLMVTEKGKTMTTTYQFFTVDVVRTYQFDSRASMSLDNWAYLQTKQNREIKNFLSEFGFQHLSDWALLNRARLLQLESLSPRSCHLVKVFHSVYRRDRVKQQHKGVRRCPDPNEAQLQEMLVYLQKQNIIIKTTVELLKELKQVAKQLRHYDIWSYREPLESYDLDTASYTLRQDLPHNSLNELDLEEREVLEFLQTSLLLALREGIEQEISDRITKLAKSQKYALFAQKFIFGLQLYYCQGLSLAKIAPQLGMTSWDQARRVLNPGDLLNKVRTLTIQKLLDKILDLMKSKELTKVPLKPDYLKTLLKGIEAFVDEEIFQEAAAEIKAGKNRSLDSLYAQQLRIYFKQKAKSLKE